MNKQETAQVLNELSRQLSVVAKSLANFSETNELPQIIGAIDNATMFTAAAAGDLSAAALMLQPPSDTN